MLLCGDAARNVLIRVRRVLGEGAKTRNQRRKRHDEEGRESLHLGAREESARLALGRRRDLQVRVIGRGLRRGRALPADEEESRGNYADEATREEDML